MPARLTGGDKVTKARFAGLNPSGRIARPEEIADVVVRMLTGALNLSTGDALLVDSGGATQRIQPLSGVSA